MYLYDTRYNKDIISRFPIDGWLFPCWKCDMITSSKIPIFYDKKILYIPFCKHCQNTETPSSHLLHKDKVKYLIDHTLV